MMLTVRTAQGNYDSPVRLLRIHFYGFVWSGRPGNVACREAQPFNFFSLGAHPFTIAVIPPTACVAYRS